MALSDSDLINSVKALGSQRDAEVAELLGISRSVISEVRAGRRGLPFRSRVVAYDLLGFGWAKMVLRHVLSEGVDAPIENQASQR